MTSEIKVYKRIFKSIRQRAAGRPWIDRATRFFHKHKIPVLIREGKNEWQIGFTIFKTKPKISPLHFFKDERTGLKFHLKFQRLYKTNHCRCSECNSYFITSVSGHREQCSDECYKIHKERDRKTRMDRNRLKRYEVLPANEIPDGHCKVCRKDISDKRIGALTCSDACRTKYSRKK